MYHGSHFLYINFFKCIIYTYAIGMQIHRHYREREKNRK